MQHLRVLVWFVFTNYTVPRQWDRAYRVIVQPVEPMQIQSRRGIHIFRRQPLALRAVKQHERGPVLSRIRCLRLTEELSLSLRRIRRMLADVDGFPWIGE